MEVQVFGVRKSADTRAALRFFAERRIKTHFVDLDEREPSPRELERFAQLGLQTAQLTDTRWLEKLAQEPLILRLPLVRWQQEVTVGEAATRWKQWYESAT
jgi:arsenate reductase (glutaredoxin)